MTFKRFAIKAVLVSGLIGSTAGVLPAPMCPDCRTMTGFTSYMTAINSRPGLLTQLWNYVSGLF